MGSIDYEELHDLLRNYVNAYNEGVGQYDVVGIWRLLLALVDNLREHHIEADFDDLNEIFNNGQKEFWLRVAKLL